MPPTATEVDGVIDRDRRSCSTMSAANTGLTRLAADPRRGRRTRSARAVSTTRRRPSRAARAPRRSISCARYDLGFRIRRLRLLARRLTELETRARGRRARADPRCDLRIARRLSRVQAHRHATRAARARCAGCGDDAGPLLDALAESHGPATLDAATDDALADGARAACRARSRRPMLLAYLGFPYFDVATLPLLQGEGLDEFDPIKVDRIAPDDAPSIRARRRRGDAEGHPVQQLRRLFQPRLSRERLSLGPAARRRADDRHRALDAARRGAR